MYIVILALMLLLSGCGGPMVFEKPGGDETALKNDHWDCQQQWESSSAGIAVRLDPINNVHAITQVRSWMQSCMERKGWKRTQ